MYKAVFTLILFTCFISNAQERFFYTNKAYGSEATFNPITLIINGGYDITQLYQISDKLFDHDYKALTHSVFSSLGHPFYTMNRYGWNHLTRTELLPLSFVRNKMQWLPNYQNHLLGGGMLFTKTREWYEVHGYPVPWILSSVTLMTQHLLNEIMETGPGEEYSADEVIDIYVFDLGGIILFSFDNVNRFFSHTLNFADWSLQATYMFPDGRIHGGQNFAMKWKLPFSDDYALFYRYGLGGNFGLSRKMNQEDYLSFGIGFRTKHLVDLSTTLREKTIETEWQAGFFYDRNNSLLWSVNFSGIDDYFICMDLYPGILKIGDFSPGFWTILGRNGNFQCGLTTTFIINFGYAN